MTRFNFEVERDTKHRRNSRGKTLRVILLFCLVALITAAVIYAIIPRTAPESKTGKPENLSENTPKNPDTEKLSTRNEKTPAINGENEENKSLPDTTDHGSTPQVTDRQTGISGKENSSTATESAGKFMPSDNELFKMTGILRKKLADGSWKSGKDVVTHRVAGGDSLEKIARKYHTTVQFLQQYNRISDPNTIRIGQKIRCFAADSWQVNISRKQGVLQIDRITGKEAIPFAIFSCQANAGITADDLVVCRRFSEPFLVDNQGRRFSPDAPENPCGEGEITLARAAVPDSRLRFSIHGKGGSAQAMAKSLAAGSVALDNQDIKLLYTIIPEKTPVKITE